MASQESEASALNDYSQLTQIVVPLEQAARTFAERDASGRIPIVIVPQRLTRIRIPLVVAGALLVAAAIALPLLVETISTNTFTLAALAAVAGIACLVLGFFEAFRLRVPEGANALLARRGRYFKTIGPGLHFILPWIQVTHLVTRREIPFDAPTVEVPTVDNVWTTVDTLALFQITDPYKFVYNISADDFDSVFLATNQEQVRRLVREVTVDQVPDLPRRDLTEFTEHLNASVARHGVTVVKVVITFAQPPADFIQSEEARQLAIVQQKEQAEKQALALRRQMDQEALQQQEVTARVERERKALEMQIRLAETRRRVVELEAATDEYRLAKLQDRLTRFPQAAQWEWAIERLGVARALASNSRAVLQLGSADDILNTFMVRDMVSEQRIDAINGGVPEAVGAPDVSE